MSESKLLKIIDDFFKAIYCIEAFPYPLNHKTVNIHSLNEIKMKENEIKKLNIDIEKMYMINDFIPIIPDKNSKIYECQHSNIYKNVKKLCKDWKKSKEFKNKYFEWMSKFDDSGEGPLLFALF